MLCFFPGVHNDAAELVHRLRRDLIEADMAVEGCRAQMAGEQIGFGAEVAPIMTSGAVHRIIQILHGAKNSSGGAAIALCQGPCSACFRGSTQRSPPVCGSAKGPPGAGAPPVRPRRTEPPFWYEPAPGAAAPPPSPRLYGAPMSVPFMTASGRPLWGSVRTTVAWIRD